MSSPSNLPALVMIAKAPTPGRVKTRLVPPCTAQQAAEIARCALSDTLAAMAATDASRRVVVLDGSPDGLVDHHAFEVLPQRGDGLGERLAGAFEDVTGPALVIGMDTPQLTPATLGQGLALLASAGTDAVLGPAEDGGYWAIGLCSPNREAFLGVPMSSDRTNVAQRARLRALGLRVAALPTLRDVDRFEDARAVARLTPGSSFARAVEAAGR